MIMLGLRNHQNSTAHLESLACNSSLLRPFTASQIHQIQLACSGPLLPFSQHAHLHMDGEDCVWPWRRSIQSVTCCRPVCFTCSPFTSLLVSWLAYNQGDSDWEAVAPSGYSHHFMLRLIPNKTSQQFSICVKHTRSLKVSVDLQAVDKQPSLPIDHKMQSVDV